MSGSLIIFQAPWEHTVTVFLIPISSGLSIGPGALPTLGKYLWTEIMRNLFLFPQIYFFLQSYILFSLNSYRLSWCLYVLLSHGYFSWAYEHAPSFLTIQTQISQFLILCVGFAKYKELVLPSYSYWGKPDIWGSTARCKKWEIYGTTVKFVYPNAVCWSVNLSHFPGWLRCSARTTFYCTQISWTGIEHLSVSVRNTEWHTVRQTTRITLQIHFKVVTRLQSI